MWIILTILSSLTCLWLLKLNKDLVNRNEYLIRQVEANRHNSGLIFEPLSDEQLKEFKKAWKEEMDKEDKN